MSYYLADDGYHDGSNPGYGPTVLNRLLGFEGSGCAAYIEAPADEITARLRRIIDGE